MKYLLILILGVLIGLHFSFRCEIFKPHDGPATIETVRCDTIIIRDTIRIPQTLTVTRVRVDTVLLPAIDSASMGKTPIAVTLPIEQHEYRGDGWQAWVSGYNSALDSLAIDRRTVTIDREVTRWRKRHWGWSAGIGMTIDHRGRIAPAIYAGFGYTF